MRTADLVRLLAADTRRRSSLRLSFFLAVVLSGAAACFAFVPLVGIRPNLLSALSDPRVAFKFAFAGSVATAALAFGLRAVRPEVRSSWFAFGAPAMLLLLTAVAVEIAVTPSTAWPAAAWGVAPLSCLAMIVAAATLPIAGLLTTMRAGAPAHPMQAGAAAGVGGGAMGAAVFALHCPNDSVLFVAIWYVLGLAVATSLGAAVGARCLRW